MSFIIPKFLITAALASLLAGCVMGPKTVHLNASFDEAKARSMMQPGNNVITGSALIRQNGGGVVSCAGNIVELIPATPYAIERIQTLYGNSARGFAPSHIRYNFVPDEPGYHSNRRSEPCDAQGNFEFRNVSDGDFFVITGVHWIVQNIQQGGGLMQRVHVSGGESRRIVLAP